MSAQNRVRAGVEAGGQFATPIRSEVAVGLTDGPERLSSLMRTQNIEARRMLRSEDPLVAAEAQGRLDVLGEVTIMLSRPDLEPDYNTSSPWRRAVFNLLRDGSDHLGRRVGDIDADHALVCRDFCFTQATRFARESRVAPDPAQKDYMEPSEWAYLVEDNRYRSALAHTYASWACALDAGDVPDPARVQALNATLQRFDFHPVDRWRGDPAPDRTEEWAEATGAESAMTGRYPT